MDKKRMFQLADHIEQLEYAQGAVGVDGDPVAFNMNNFCGSACCIAGWANFLFPDKEEYGLEDLSLDGRVQAGAELKLGLDPDTAGELFMPSDGPFFDEDYEVLIPYEDITPKQAANAIRLVANGEHVKDAWRVAMEDVG